jgi:hypothetical protein
MLPIGEEAPVTRETEQSLLLWTSAVAQPRRQSCRPPAEFRMGRAVGAMSMDATSREPKEEKVPSLAEILAATRAAFADVPEDEFNREVDKALAEVRREMAAEREARARKRRASS